MCRRIPCIGIEINKKRRNLIVAVLRLKALALPIYAEWQRAEPTLIYVKYVQPFSQSLAQDITYPRASTVAQSLT